MPRVGVQSIPQRALPLRPLSPDRSLAGRLQYNTDVRERLRAAVRDQRTWERFDAPGIATVRVAEAHGTAADRTVIVRLPRSSTP
jgi:hypothetical protein